MNCRFDLGRKKRSIFKEAYWGKSFAVKRIGREEVLTKRMS